MEIKNALAFIFLLYMIFIIGYRYFTLIIFKMRPSWYQWLYLFRNGILFSTSKQKKLRKAEFQDFSQSLKCSNSNFKFSKVKVKVLCSIEMYSRLKKYMTKFKPLKWHNRGKKFKQHALLLIIAELETFWDQKKIWDQHA